MFNFYKKSKNKIYQEAGFTLLESLLALLIFSVGIIGVLGLSLYNLRTARENYNRVVATDLAQENIELVRNIRDSNWLKYEANEDCDSDTPGLQFCAWDKGLEREFFVIDYIGISTSCFSLDDCGDTGIVYIDSDNFFNNRQVGMKTSFYRVAGAQAICFNASGLPQEYLGAGLDCGLDLKIGLQVSAKVRWTEGSAVRSVLLKENLYNWRR